MKDIVELRKKSERLREYLKGGEALQKQMQAYAESLIFDEDPDLTLEE